MIDLYNFPFLIMCSDNLTVVILQEDEKEIEHFLTYYYNWIRQRFILEEETEYFASGNHPLEHAEYKVNGTVYDFRVHNKI